MGEHTGIEWCDHTFNPWWGCTKVSEACKFCYAEGVANRFGKNLWGPGHDIRTFGDKHWNDPLRWNRKAEEEGVRRRVFCGSMCDIFEAGEFESGTTMDTLRSVLWALITKTPHLDWLLLTKRPENVRRMVPVEWIATKEAIGFGWTRDVRPEWPDNVWIGTTVETQERADERIPHLVKIPARVRFLSCEPLRGPLELNRATVVDPRPVSEPVEHVPPLALLSWVIAGGESGTRARPANADWYRSLRDQCADAGVPFFFKQWGNWATKAAIEENGETFFPGNHTVTFGTGETVYRVASKSAAGAFLDGVEHKAFPS